MESITNLNQDSIKGIQDLIEINIDSSKGFTEAAEKVENPGIANLFRQCGTERKQYAKQLQDIVRENHKEPKDSGTAAGMMHRWWLDIRGTVTGGNEHTVLADAERGEDSIKSRYEETLKETAGSPVNDLLTKQYAGVKARHDQIRDMRDARA